MELEVNKSHKKIDLKNLKRSSRNILIGGIVGLSIFSGVNQTPVYASSASINSDESSNVDIPDEYISAIQTCLPYGMSIDNITKSDLEKLDFLYLMLDEDSPSLDFLKYCKNLKSLSINLRCDGNKCSALSTINSLENLSEVGIYSLDKNYTLYSNDLEFIDTSSNLEKLSISNCDLAPGVEENINKVKVFDYSMDNYARSVDIDFSKLTNLEKLDLSDNKPYTVAIYLNSSEYNELINNGVNIVFSSDEDKNKYLDACSRLDDIVNNLDVNESSSDREKLDAILIYTLENLEYDNGVSQALMNNDSNVSSIASSFYEDGELYGALYKDSAICGNYGALVEALSDRLSAPEKSTIVTSSNHLWNLMDIDGESYYVDATWLDQQSTIEFVPVNGGLGGLEGIPTSAADEIRKGKADTLDWYMENPNPEYIATIDNSKESHIPDRALPEYMPENTQEYSLEEDSGIKDSVEATEKITEQESEEVSKEVSKDTKKVDSTKKIKLKINGKVVGATVGGLIGIMSALGGAIHVVKKRQEKKRRKQRELDNMFSHEYNNYNSSYNPYGNYNDYSRKY